MISRSQCAGAALLFLPAAAFAQLPPSGGEAWPPSSRAVIAWDSTAAGEDSLDQISLEAIFGGMGFTTERAGKPGIGTSLPGNTSLLVIPHAAASRMTAAESRAVVASIERGLTLVTDGVSPLGGALGIRAGREVPVAVLEDQFQPEIRIRWPNHRVVAWISGYPKNDATPVYQDSSREHLLAVILQRNTGRCLYVAPLIDPVTGSGYARFPTLPWVVERGLGVRPPLRRRGADAYFDPGYRWRIPADSLARMWHAWGIRGVHVAAWYASSDPPYDYAALLQALHNNGLLAYAWLEWPYIGKGFWDRHPAWRQKNALLQDAHLDFLYLMDLQNPDCMEAALNELSGFLRADWDGVDVAEFTMTGAGREALEGPAVPEFFTGFTDVGRRMFREQAGFDPLELFAPASHHYWKSDTAALHTFYRYRTGVNLAAERTIFTRLRSAEEGAAGPRELMLTIVDNMLHPEFDNLLGFDLNTTVSIAREFDLTLVAEDPYTEWSRPPERYTTMGSNYRRLLGERPFMIDVNVVPLPEDRKELYSTAQPTGTEFLELWKYASRETRRVCYYCESSVLENDWLLLPAAMAGSGSVTAKGTAVTVSAPYTVALRSGAGNVRMDGEPWPARSDSEIIVPAGKHLITMDAEHGADVNLRLVSITGELLGAWCSADTLSLEYSARGRCALGFGLRPSAVLLDGMPAHPPVHDSGSGSVFYVPGGRHRFTVIRAPGGESLSR